MGKLSHRMGLDGHGDEQGSNLQQAPRPICFSRCLLSPGSLGGEGLSRPSTHSAAGRVMGEVAGRALLLEAKRRRAARISQEPGCRAGRREWVSSQNTACAAAQLWERPRGSAFNFTFKKQEDGVTGGWGRGMFLSAFSPFSFYGHRWWPSFLLSWSLSFLVSVSALCLWPFLPLAAASLPRVPLWLLSESVFPSSLSPAGLLPLARLHRSLAGSPSPRLRARLRVSVPVSASPSAAP